MSTHPASDAPIAAPRSRGYLLRIEITASRRRWLGEMAREAGVSADELASRLLTDVIDEDAAAHKGQR